MSEREGVLFLHDILESIEKRKRRNKGCDYIVGSAEASPSPASTGWLRLSGNSFSREWFAVGAHGRAPLQGGYIGSAGALSSSST